MSKRGRPRYPDILTPREQEVLELVRGGLSNPEIADRLGIGREGVKYHVSEILSKLGVSSREEAAQWRSEEARSRWLRAGAPLLFLRRLSMSRLSTTLAAGLLMAIVIGIGLLLWMVLKTHDDSNRLVAIAAGGEHTCVLTKRGGVKCWGANQFGQLGDGTTTDRTTPVDVIGLTSGVVAITAGGWQEFDHTCALTREGGVKCWGYNVNGQLGDDQGCGLACPVPVDVSGLSGGVTAIAAGAFHTCAVTTGGGVKCWGANEFGQSGKREASPRRCGSSPCTLTPTGVPGLASGVTAISAGSSSTCILTSAGGVKCWGNASNAPEDVAGLTSGLVAIAVGGDIGDHACALTATGGVKCWGHNEMGQLGHQACGPFSCVSTVVDVTELANSVATIAAGGQHTCALTKAGGVKCWGADQYGQLGNGTFGGGIVDVQGLSSAVAAIAAGGDHTCALTKRDGVRCWGLNDGSQLGPNGNTERTCSNARCNATPVEVSVFATPGPTATVPSNYRLSVAYTLDDAVFLANQRARSCPPTCTFFPESLNYVETTIREARAVFDPDRTRLTWVVPESFRCWVFVYYGQFANYNRFTNESSPFSTLVVVVPIGARGVSSTQGNERYDLSKLGELKQVPGPLPTFGRLLTPTPAP